VHRKKPRPDRNPGGEVRDPFTERSLVERVVLEADDRLDILLGGVAFG
jgi:hypothetical protein